MIFILTESVEGLDKKFNLNYYSRLRFTDNLLPQLTAAAETGALSRNVSVLSAGKEGPLYLDDLELKRNYSVRTCANHATTMNSLAALHLANLHPQTSFVHIYPVCLLSWQSIVSRTDKNVGSCQNQRPAGFGTAQMGRKSHLGGHDPLRSSHQGVRGTSTVCCNKCNVCTQSPVCRINQGRWSLPAALG